MAKVITQATFDEVVKENLEEFEMTEQEAVDDAVKQFEAQGVNLINIVKIPGKALAINNEIERLQNLVDEEELNAEEITKILKMLIQNIRNEMSSKLLAAEKGIYPALKKCFKKANANSKIETIEALSTLMDGYPDLLDADGTDMLLGLLDENGPVEQLEPSLRWLVAVVTKHEKNRAALIRGQVALKLKSLTQRYGNRDEIVTAVCTATQVLILDDDVRVTVGDAHEHARALATELLPLFTSILPKYIADVETTTKLLKAVTSLLVRNEFCILFHGQEGLKYVLDVMVEHPNIENVARECFLLLKCLAGSDEVKESIIPAGAAPLLVASLEKHYKSSNVAIAGCQCFAALSLRSPTNSRELVAAGGAETLVRCLLHWKKNRSIMTQGCAAIRNQVSRCPDLRDEYRVLQVDELLRDAQKLHGDFAFEAKSILLDLGCEVKLKEEWRGTGVQLDQ